MSKTENLVIDPNELQANAELQRIMDEWRDVTQEVKAVVLRKVVSLAKEGSVDPIHLVSAVTSLSLAVGQLIALMENEEMEENLIQAFSEGVKLAVNGVRLERLEEERV
jgi:hypothetical protein